MFERIQGSASRLRNRLHPKPYYQLLAPNDGSHKALEQSLTSDYISRKTIGFIVLETMPGATISPALIKPPLRKWSNIDEHVGELNGREPFASLQLRSRLAKVAISHDPHHGKLAVEIYDDARSCNKAFQQDDRQILTSFVNRLRNKIFDHFIDYHLANGRFDSSKVVAFKFLAKQLTDMDTGSYTKLRSDVF